MGKGAGSVHLWVMDLKVGQILLEISAITIKVAKKITTSSVKGAFGFTDSNNIGSMFYTAMQTVPAFLPAQYSGAITMGGYMGANDDIEFHG